MFRDRSGSEGSSDRYAEGVEGGLSVSGAFDPLKSWFGLLTEQGSLDYYSLLGLPRFEQDSQVISQAWKARMLVVQRHLRGPYSSQAHEILALLNEAKACLLNPKRKAEYDRKLASSPHSRGGQIPGQATGADLHPRCEKNAARPSIGSGGETAGLTTADFSRGKKSLGELPTAVKKLEAGHHHNPEGSDLCPGTLVGVSARDRTPQERKTSGLGNSSVTNSELLHTVVLGMGAGALLLLLVFAVYHVSISPSKEDQGTSVSQRTGTIGPSPGEANREAGNASALPPAVGGENDGQSEANKPTTCLGSELGQREGQLRSEYQHRSTTGEKADQPPPATLDHSFANFSFPGRPQPNPGASQSSVPEPPREEGNRGAARPNNPVLSPPKSVPSDRNEPAVPEESKPLGPESVPVKSAPPLLEKPLRSEGRPGSAVPEFGTFNPPERKITDRAAAETLIRTAGVVTKSRLDSLANFVRHADEMVLLYETFLTLEGIPDREKESATSYLPMWKKRAEQQFVRLGDEWMAPAEWTRRKQEARSAFQHGVSAARTDAQLAIKELQRAGRLDPEFVTGYFVLGVLHGVYGPNPEPAKTCFRACVSRKPNHLPALNNLGVVESRRRSFASALSAFRKAVELGGSPEVTHNLKVILLADQKGIMPLPPATKQAFSQLYARASTQFAEAKDPAGFVPKGFLYMLPTTKDLLEDGAAKVSLQSQLARSSPPPLSPECRVVASAVGVVVAPTFLLTSGAGILGGDAFQIVPLREDLSPAIAQLVATGEELGLDFALLRVPGYPGRPLPLRQARSSMTVGSEVNTLSCLPDDSTRPRLTIEKCSIAANPDTSGGLFGKYYILAGKPPSTLLGSVVVDHTGAVVAMYDILAVFGFGGYTPAIPIECALPFLQSQIPGFHPALIQLEAGDQSDVAEKAREAVVLVHVLSTPAMLDLLTGRGTSGPGTPVGPALLDPWCLFCNGEGRVDCPNRRCNNGRISTTRERLLGHDPNTGRPIIVREPTTIQCGDCGGRGRVACPVCKGTRFMK